MGLRVDRFTDRSKQTQAREIALLRPVGAPAHERANRRRRGIENRHAVALDDLPEAILLRPVWSAFVHHDRCTVCQRPVHHVTVSGHPSDIGRAPENILVLDVEDPFHRRVGAGEIAAGRVHDSLRLPGRARRVEDVEKILRVHLLRLTRIRRILHQPVIPVVAPLLDVDHVGTLSPMQPLHDDDVRDRRCSLQRFIGHLLERDDRAAPPSAIGGDEQVALSIVDAVAKRFGAETAEDDRVRRANARAREHGNRELGDERQVNRDAIAPLHAERLQHVGELTDLPVEIEVRQRPAVTRLAFPDERRLVTPCASRVTIDAIDARVDRAADKPFRVRRLPLEDFRPRSEPLELGRKRGPEGFRIFFGACVHAFVVNVGVGAKLLRGREGAILLKQVRNVGRWFLLGHGGYFTAPLVADSGEQIAPRL